MESVDNRDKLSRLLAGELSVAAFETSAWRDYRLVVAPFLGELDFMRLARSYAELTQIQRDLDSWRRLGGTTLREQDERRLAQSLEQARENGRLLRKQEEASPWMLAATLLWRRRVATQSEIRNEFPSGAHPERRVAEESGETESSETPKR